MSIKILDFNEIDINNINFKTPEKIKGSYYSFADYKGNDIYIKTPVLKNTTNIVKLESRCYIELEIDNNKEFYDFFSNFDDNNILKIHKESHNWFSKEFPLDIVEEFYSSPLKHKKQNPKLKIKIPLIKNKVDCLIYDKNNSLITNFDEYNNVICLLKFNGLKFLSQQVISEWIPIQIKINEIVNDHNIEYLIKDDFTNSFTTSEPTDTVIESNSKVEVDNTINNQNNLETPDNQNNLENPDNQNNLETPDNLNNLETPDNQNNLETPDNLNNLETPDNLNNLETPVNFDEIDNTEIVYEEKNTNENDLNLLYIDTKTELDKYKKLFFKNKKQLEDIRKLFN